jgi:hypothetical protein
MLQHTVVYLSEVVTPAISEITQHQIKKHLAEVYILSKNGR